MFPFVLLAQILISGANARRNSSSATCADIESEVQYNSSTSQQFPAMKLENKHAQSGDYWIVPDTSRSWQLSYHVQRQPVDTSSPEWQGPGKNYYYGTMLLDTKDSNLTGIGSCHQTLQAEIGVQGYTMSREVLDRSEREGGDCRILLGNDCVEALRKTSAEEVTEWSLKKGGCGMSSEIPPECSGRGLSRLNTKRMYLDNFNTVANGYPSSHFDPSLECNGVNASSTHIATVTDGMNYGPAVQFPVVDIITFWPNRLTAGMENYTSCWDGDVRVEIVCMRSTTVADGSTKPPSVSELLNDKNAVFPKNQTTPESSGAESVTNEIQRWMSAVVMALVFSL